MRQAEIEVGKVYITNQGKKVRVDRIWHTESYKWRDVMGDLHNSGSSMIRYTCYNLETKKAITIKSAAKFSREVVA